MHLDSNVDWTKEQLATVLARSKRESRKNCKRYLFDLGGKGSSEELDEVIQLALADPDVVKLSEEIDLERMQTRMRIKREGTELFEPIREQIRDAMKQRKMSIADLATIACMTGDAVSTVVHGDRIPTTEQLLAIASALDKRLSLE